MNDESIHTASARTRPPLRRRPDARPGAGAGQRPNALSGQSSGPTSGPSPGEAARQPPSLRQLIGIALVVFFTLPLVLTHVQGFEIQSAMILAPLLLPVIVQLRMTVTVSMLFSAVLLSLLGIVYVGIVHTGQLSARAVLSMLFFYLPYSYYFIGWHFVKTELRLANVLRIMSLTGAVFGLVVLGGLTLRGEYIRVFGCINDRCGAYLWGDFLGWPVYASFGVNTLAAIYCLLALICAAHVMFHRMDRWKWLEIAGALSLMSLVIGSASRSAVLSLIIGLLVLAFFYQNRNQRARVIGLSVIASVAIVVSLSGVASGIFEQYLGYRMDATVDLIAEGDVRGASSNRVDLFLTAMEQIVDSPIFGTGFQGFGYSGAGYNIESSSAHLQVLTIVWKTGLLAAACLFYFFFRTLMVFAEFFRRAQQPLVRNLSLALIVAVLVQSLVWDVVLVPWIGGLLLFTLGAAQGIVERYRGLSSAGARRRKRRPGGAVRPMQPSLQRRARPRPAPGRSAQTIAEKAAPARPPARFDLHSDHNDPGVAIGARRGVEAQSGRSLQMNLQPSPARHPQSFLPAADLKPPTIYAGSLLKDRAYRLARRQAQSKPAGRNGPPTGSTPAPDRQ